MLKLSTLKRLLERGRLQNLSKNVMDFYNDREARKESEEEEETEGGTPIAEKGNETMKTKKPPRICGGVFSYSLEVRGGKS